MSVFISYSSADEGFAVQLERALTANGIGAWFAPKSIGDGQDFAECIGRELSPHVSEDEDDRIDEDLGHLRKSSVFILLLSANSMRSTCLVSKKASQPPMRSLRRPSEAWISWSQFG